jgi:hypothetical protein
MAGYGDPDIAKGTRNLIPINQRPPEEQAIIRQHAAEASARKKRERRQTREILNDILYSTFSGKDEIKQKIKDKGIENTELAGLLLQMAGKAAHSANMAELIFKLTGDLQQESQTVNVNVYSQMTDEQLDQERQKILSGNDEIDVTPKPPEIEE